MKTASPSQADERILVLAPRGRDAALTCALLERAGIAATACASMSALCDTLDGDGALGLILTEETLTPPALRTLRAWLDTQESWSDSPIVVFLSRRDDVTTPTFTAEMAKTLGNVTLLERPVEQLTMLSAAHAAVRARRRQYEARRAIAAEQLAVKQRDRFLAMLGHELRNPLAAISLAVQADENGGKYRDIVGRQTAHLTRLVDDLLDVARVTSGKVVLKSALVDLRVVLERAIDVVRPALNAQELTLSTELPDQPAWIRGDSVRLEQVAVNLLGNAAKYTPAGGHVWARVAQQGEQAVLSVRDDGLGVAPDMLPRIFELFTQVDASLDRANGGMGIGLTLVRDLVELHGGSVAVESPGLGQGSTFRLHFPLSAERPAEARLKPRAQAADAARSVLVVEDSEDSRELLAMMLERRGHRVSMAADGLRGVALALADHPDVVVVDIGLPGLDGFGVAREIRSELGHDVRLIALTGYGQPEDRARAHDAGFDAHLTKPVDFAQLQALIAAP